MRAASGKRLPTMRSASCAQRPEALEIGGMMLAVAIEEEEPFDGCGQRGSARDAARRSCRDADRRASRTSAPACAARSAVASVLASSMTVTAKPAREATAHDTGRWWRPRCARG